MPGAPAEEEGAPIGRVSRPEVQEQPVCHAALGSGFRLKWGGPFGGCGEVQATSAEADRDKAEEPYGAGFGLEAEAVSA